MTRHLSAPATEPRRTGASRLPGICRGVLLLAIVLVALGLRLWGTAWPVGHHPDEPTIARWISYRASHRHLHKAYPDGFFTLTKPVWRAAGLCWQTRDAIRRWRGIPLKPQPPSPDAVLFARALNAWLGALSVVFVYLLASRVSGSKWAALLGSAFFAVAQYHVEHAHYAETDIAMVSALAVALWLWSLASDRRSRVAYVAACAASGFATGTKYTLVVLLALVAVGAYRKRGAETVLRHAGALLARAGCGIAAFVAGFAVAAPGVLRGRWFLHELARERATVYGETHALMADAGTRLAARVTGHGHALAEGFRSLGWGWSCIVVAAVPLCFTPRLRRHWPVTLLFPALYLYYYMLVAPWVRTQEFLNLLPVFACAPALLLATAHGAKRSLLSNTACAALLAAAALSLFGATLNGTRVASLFGWRETRRMAAEWCERHAPHGANAGVEQYTKPVGSGSFGSVVNVFEIEFHGIDYPLTNDCRYLVRNATALGRGVQDRRTGRPFPRYQAKYEDFQRRAELLARWSSLAPQGIRATFAGPAMELYGLERPTADLRLELPLPRPTWISPADRETYFPVGSRLGAATMVELTPFPRQVGVGGPPAAGETYFLLRTMERDANVRLHGFGRRRSVDVGPHDLRIVQLRRSPALPRFNAFEVVRADVETRPHMYEVPCFAQVAFSPAEAGLPAFFAGRPGNALDALGREQLRRSAPALTHLLAVAAAEWDLAQSVRQEAELALQRLRTALDTPASRLRIGGVAGTHYEDFAQLRTTPDPAAAFLAVEPAPTPPELAGRSGTCWAEIPIPVLLPPGRHELTLSVSPRLPAPDTPYSIVAANGNILAAGRWKPANGEYVHASTVIFAERMHRPRVWVTSRQPLVLECHSAEVSWTLHAALETMHAALSASLAAGALNRGDGTAALEFLRGLDAPWNVREVRRLRFEALRRQPAGDVARTREAARALLEIAPQHFAALEFLGSTDAGARARADVQLRDNPAPPLTFGNWLSLVHHAYEPATGTLRCVFEALHPDTPELKLTVWTHRRRWRRQSSIAVSPSRLSTGERVTVLAQMRAGNDTGPDPAATAISVETDTTWYPGRVVTSDGRERITLASLVGGE